MDNITGTPTPRSACYSAVRAAPYLLMDATTRMNLRGTTLSKRWSLVVTGWSNLLDILEKMLIIEKRPVAPRDEHNVVGWPTCLSFPGTFPVLALKVPQPRKTGMVSCIVMTKSRPAGSSLELMELFYILAMVVVIYSIPVLKFIELYTKRRDQTNFIV